MRSTPFTLDKVKQVFDRFIELKKLSSSYKSLLKNEMKLVGENTVVLQLKNSVERRFLGEIEVELLKYTRDQLENDHLQVDTSFNQAETVRTAYTNAEIFDEMIAKKPELKQLRDALGLDTDF